MTLAKVSLYSILKARWYTYHCVKAQWYACKSGSEITDGYFGEKDNWLSKEKIPWLPMTSISSQKTFSCTFQTLVEKGTFFHDFPDCMNPVLYGNNLITYQMKFHERKGKKHAGALQNWDHFMVYFYLL